MLYPPFLAYNTMFSVLVCVSPLADNYDSSCNCSRLQKLNNQDLHILSVLIVSTPTHKKIPPFWGWDFLWIIFPYYSAGAIASDGHTLAQVPQSVHSSGLIL